MKSEVLFTCHQPEGKYACLILKDINLEQITFRMKIWWPVMTNGKEMSFDNISGKSVLLFAE